MPGCWSMLLCPQLCIMSFKLASQRLDGVQYFVSIACQHQGNGGQQLSQQSCARITHEFTQLWAVSMNNQQWDLLRENVSTVSHTALPPALWWHQRPKQLSITSANSRSLQSLPGSTPQRARGDFSKARGDYALDNARGSTIFKSQ